MLHIGMLTLQDGVTEEQRDAITVALRALVGTIPGLVSARTGTDLGVADTNADLIFVMEFDSREAWEAYRTHEAHVAVIRDHIAPVLQSKSFVQIADWSHVQAP